MTLLHKLLTTTLLCLAAVLHANAQTLRPQTTKKLPSTFTIDGITYEKNYDGVSVIKIASEIHETYIKPNWNVTIPEHVDVYKVTQIGRDGKNTLSIVSDIKELTIPGSIRSICPNAFSNCKSLKKVKINKGVKSLSAGMFSGCTALDSISLPPELEYINDSTFSQCTSLREIKLPKELESIGYSAFKGCSSLDTITLPCSLKEIRWDTFLNCNSLKSILVDEGNPNFSSDGTALYNASNTELISFPCGATKYITPHKLRYIRSHTFYKCDSLHYIQFMNDSTDLQIYSKALVNCPNLATVIIGANVYYGSQPFSNSHIRKLIIQNKVKASLENIFSGRCAIDTISALPIYEDKVKEYQDSVTFIPYVPYIASYIAVYPRSISVKLVTNKLWNKVSDTPLDSISPIVEIDNKKIEPNEKGLYICRYLQPNDLCEITIYAINNNGKYVSGYNLHKKTENYIHLNTYKIYDTHIIATISQTLDPNIEVPQKCGLYCDGNFYETEYNGQTQSVRIKDLWPNKAYNIEYQEYRNGEVSYRHRITTETVKPYIGAQFSDITPTTYTLRGYNNSSKDLNVVEEGWTFDGSTISEHSKTLLVTGCNPESTIKPARYAIIVKKGDETKFYSDGISYNQTHPALTLKTVAKAKAISNTVALICAETNIDERETNVGFEWRRYDAPELVPSSEANCPIIDSTMTGALRNLSENTYYKFRPFYKSNSGKTWYGEWSAFGTADAYVYFDPTVRTFEVNCDNETTATVRAFVIAGSDEIKEQGFEYWKHCSTESTSTRYVATAKEDNHQTIISTGQRMTATLENLEPNTTYSVRAYVTTEHGTTYGEEQIFSTPAPTAIGYVKLDDTQSGEMTVTINKTNAQGVDFVVNGTRNEISAKLYSISGTVLSTTSTTDNGSDARNIKMQTQHLQSGMYLLCVTDGACTKTIRLAIK